jgi:hypothetical protein
MLEDPCLSETARKVMQSDGRWLLWFFYALFWWPRQLFALFASYEPMLLPPVLPRNPQNLSMTFVSVHTLVSCRC